MMIRKKFFAVAIVIVSTLASGATSAFPVKVDDDTFGRIALLGQVGFSAVNGPANADHVADQTINNARIAIGGQLTDLYKFGFNFDMNISRDKEGAASRPTGLTDGFILYPVSPGVQTPGETIKPRRNDEGTKTC